MPREVLLVIASLAVPVVFVGIVALLHDRDRPRGRELLAAVVERTVVSLLGFAVGWLALARWSIAVPGCPPGGDCATQCFTIYGARVPCSGWWDALAVVFGIVMAGFANLAVDAEPQRLPAITEPDRTSVTNVTSDR
jgi:hypothetical protein